MLPARIENQINKSTEDIVSILQSIRSMDEQIQALVARLDAMSPHSPYNLAEAARAKRPKILDELAAMDEDVKERKRHA